MTRPLVVDAEVVELLCDEPELLAIADAVAATQERPRRKRRRPRVLGVAVVLLVVAAVVALVPQRSDGDPLLGDAVAAIGDQPVIHARIEARVPQSEVVDLATGRTVPMTVSLEFWFDEPRARLRTVVRRGGVVIDEFLETRAQAVSASGPVRLAGPGGPALSPALAGFATGYRDSLRSGRAEVVAGGEVDGREVSWLLLGSGAARQRVAVDTRTSTPLLIVPIDARGRRAAISWRVRTIEAVARVEAQFAAPAARQPRPFRGDVRASEPVSSAQVGAAVDWVPVWLGQSWQGLRLVSLELQTLSRGYAPGSGAASSRSSRGLSIRYADGTGGFVEIAQASAPEPAYAFAEGALTFNRNPIPRSGRVEVVELGGSGLPRVIGQLRLPGVYVTMWASTRELCLAAARALTRITN